MNRRICLLFARSFALCAALATAAPSARAQTAPNRTATPASPFDTNAVELVDGVVRDGTSARAILPLLELWRSWDWLSPGVATAQLRRLTGQRTLNPAVRAYAQMLLARSLLRDGDAAGAAQAFDALGYVRQWEVLGPFDNEGKAGFEAQQAPETSLAAPRDESARFPGRERPVAWRAFPDVDHFGYVSFDAVFRPDENVCGFAETYVRLPSAQSISLWVGAGGAVKVYFNGVLALHDPAYRMPDPDRQAVVVPGRAGWNRIVVKNCVTDSAWGFFLRVADANGAPLRAALAVDPTAGGNPVGITAAPGAAPHALTTPLTTFEHAAAGASAPAQALEDLARFLAWTGADDPAERRAKQLSARAADSAPTIARLVLAASNADERAELVRFAQRASELGASDPQALLLSAQAIRGGFVPEDAFHLLDQIPPNTRAAADAATLRAAILRELGLPEDAAAVIHALAGTLPPSPALARLVADAADGASRRNEAEAARERVLAMRYDDLGVRRAVVSDAIDRDDSATATAQLDALRVILPDNGHNLTYMAETYEALGMSERAVSAYREALALAPEDSPTIVELGRALLRANQRDAAAQELRRALVLRPQDADTRELLEQLHPEQRPDEAFAASSDELLRRRRETTEVPVDILENLTVNTVFENGLGSSFRQMVVQVHDAEGARRYRTYPIQFDPASQRVDIRLARVYRHDGTTAEALQTFEQQLGEPWYRMYYDTRALVVVFPDLEPGDTVELRYRVDDVAHRNVFADYYGDLHPLQGTDPVKKMEYVLITPAARQFYFNDAHMTGLTHTTHVDGTTRTDRFVATDVPAIQAEPGMPGITEVAPYLHVSTYRTWQEVGHWYWGLIHDQLYADASLRDTVAQLVRGARNTHEKVRRIHDWVVAHTRYVALEFGIHGYLPYRVPQIVQRGFGDCKDKASLLYTMLREAGVDARFVLVRTRRNGAIGELPASLAVFDHAIAYVPELDMYLDGTAEHSGIAELPNMDQGVNVLVVGPDSAEWRRTPVLPAAFNRRTRHLEVDVGHDGGAHLVATDVVAGGDAQQLRSYYQAEGTRTERFERTLGALFPGLHVEMQRFSSLTDLDAPVRVDYRATAPQLAARDGNELRLSPTVLDDLTRSFTRSPTRHYALDIGSTASYVEDRVIRATDGLGVGPPPAGGNAQSRFGKLTMTAAHSSEREITVHTEFELDVDRVEPADYPAFRDWVSHVDEILRQRVVLVGGAQ